MYYMNCSSPLFALLPAVLLSPHICCLHLISFSSFKYISQTPDTEERHFSCDYAHLFIFHFKKEQPSYLRWGFP